MSKLAHSNQETMAIIERQAAAEAHMPDEPIKRFSRSVVLDRIEREMTILEDRYGWTRNHIGTAEIERGNRQRAADVGRYIILCDLWEEFYA